MYFVHKSLSQVTIGALPGSEPLQGEVGPWSSASKQWNQDVSYDIGNCRQNWKFKDFQPHIHQDVCYKY